MADTPQYTQLTPQQMQSYGLAPSSTPTAPTSVPTSTFAEYTRQLQGPSWSIPVNSQVTSSRTLESPPLAPKITQSTQITQIPQPKYPGSVYGVSGDTQTSTYKPLESERRLPAPTITPQEFDQKQSQIRQLESRYNPYVLEAEKLTAEYEELEKRTDFQNQGDIDRLNLLGASLNTQVAKAEPLINQRNKIIQEIDPEIDRRNMLAEKQNTYTQKLEDINKKYFEEKQRFTDVTGIGAGLSQMPETVIQPKGSGFLWGLPLVGRGARYKRETEKVEEEYAKSMPKYEMDVKIPDLKTIDLRSDMSELRDIHRDLRTGELKVTPETVDRIEKAKLKSGMLTERALETDTTAEMYGKTLQAYPVKTTDKWIVEDINTELDNYYTKQTLKTGARVGVIAASVAFAPAAIAGIGSLGTGGALAAKVLTSKAVGYGLMGLAGADVGMKGYQGYQAFQEDKPILGTTRLVEGASNVAGIYAGVKWARATSGKPWQTFTKPVKAYTAQRNIRKWEKGLYEPSGDVKAYNPKTGKWEIKPATKYTGKGDPYVTYESPRGYTQRTLYGKGISPKTIKQKLYPIESKVRLQSKPYKYFDKKTGKWKTRWSDSVEENVGKEASVKKVTSTIAKGTKEAGFDTTTAGQTKTAQDHIYAIDKVTGKRIKLDSTNFVDGMYGKGKTIRISGKPDTSFDRYTFIETVSPPKMGSQLSARDAVPSKDTDIFKYLPSGTKKDFAFRARVRKELPDAIFTRQGKPKIPTHVDKSTTYYVSDKGHVVKVSKGKITSEYDMTGTGTQTPTTQKPYTGDKAITGKKAMEDYMRMTGQGKVVTAQQSAPISEVEIGGIKSLYGTSLPGRADPALISIPGYVPTPTVTPEQIFLTKFGLAAGVSSISGTGQKTEMKQTTDQIAPLKQRSQTELLSGVELLEPLKPATEQDLWISLGTDAASLTRVSSIAGGGVGQSTGTTPVVIPAVAITPIENPETIPESVYQTPSPVPPIVPIIPLIGLGAMPWFSVPSNRSYGRKRVGKASRYVSPVADWRIFFKRKFGYLGAPGVERTSNLYSPSYAKGSDSDVGDFESKINKMIGGK